jgi:hypothetical protein
MPLGLTAKGRGLPRAGGEMADKGIIISAKEAAADFDLACILNDNYLEVWFQRQ